MIQIKDRKIFLFQFFKTRKVINKLKQEKREEDYYNVFYLLFQQKRILEAKINQNINIFEEEEEKKNE